METAQSQAFAIYQRTRQVQTVGTGAGHCPGVTHPAVVVEKSPPTTKFSSTGQSGAPETELATNKARADPHHPERHRRAQRLSERKSMLWRLKAPLRTTGPGASGLSGHHDLTGRANSADRAFEKPSRRWSIWPGIEPFHAGRPRPHSSALALAEMHDAAAHSLRLVFEPARPTTLTVIQGHAA